jgi:branched-chain amino acid transport system ATP-binding protein
MLSVENLDLFYGDAQALDRVSIEVEEAAIVAIVGANGAGKTSLIRAIAGMRAPAHGRIVLRGTDIAGLPPHRVCDLGIGQVAEGRQIFPTLTVVENLEVGAMLPRARAHRGRNLDRVLSLFPVLAERRQQAGGTLSGGEQQMLAIGRALMQNPRVLLMDEPSEGLAPQIVAEVMGTIRKLKESGLSIVLVEQSPKLVFDIADDIVILNSGRVAVVSTAAELKRQELDLRQHLGVY